MRQVFALDIGGTAIKFGLVATEGQFLARGEEPFKRELPFAALIDRFEALYQQSCAAHGPADALAIAMPGYALAHSGVVIDGGGNVPALRDGSAPSVLADRLSLPVVFENDGVAAAIGEMRYGAGREHRRFALFTLGTGVGGAVVIDGAAIAGPQGEPPEPGAMIVGFDRDGAPISLEAAASAGGFLRAYATRTGRALVSAEALFARADDGDSPAGEAIDETCRSIAIAASALVNALGLDAVILGGGVSAAGARLAAGVETHLPAFCWPFLAARARVRVAELGNAAGLLGVAALAFDRASGEAKAARPRSGAGVTR